MKKYDLIFIVILRDCKNKVSRTVLKIIIQQLLFNLTISRPFIAPITQFLSWYTGNFVLEATKLAEAWAFEVRTMKAFTWV